MCDNKNIQDNRDRSRINVNEEYELRYWSEKFNVPSEELKKAVEEVGIIAEEVEKYLARK